MDQEFSSPVRNYGTSLEYRSDKSFTCKITNGHKAMEGGKGNTMVEDKLATIKAYRRAKGDVGWNPSS
jgi:hypothetical protein